MNLIDLKEEKEGGEQISSNNQIPCVRQAG